MTHELKMTKKWQRPKKGDMADKRCVNVTKYDGYQHKKITYKHWCFGCEYYVCTDCAKDDDRSPIAHAPLVHHNIEVEDAVVH